MHCIHKDRLEAQLLCAKKKWAVHFNPVLKPHTTPALCVFSHCEIWAIQRSYSLLSYRSLRSWPWLDYQGRKAAVRARKSVWVFVWVHACKSKWVLTFINPDTPNTPLAHQNVECRAGKLTKEEKKSMWCKLNYIRLCADVILSRFKYHMKINVTVTPF